MFTGIVEEIGTITALQHGAKSVTLDIAASKVIEGTQVGDSIATDGVCLTVTGLSGSHFTAHVMHETLRRTAFSQLSAGSHVNLERALTLQSRLGGHLVSGHIDGTGRIARIVRDDSALLLTIECDTRLLRYIIVKGSITVQGVSLTVVSVDERAFSVSLIPHTQSATTLHEAKVGQLVNLENDIIAKYVERLLSHDKPQESGLMDLLSRNGFI